MTGFCIRYVEARRAITWTVAALVPALTAALTALPAKANDKGFDPAAPLVAGFFLADEELDQTRAGAENGTLSLDLVGNEEIAVILWDEMSPNVKVVGNSQSSGSGGGYTVSSSLAHR